MSNKLTKILTYCTLVLVILAVVITTAICLTTALTYKVSVDVVIQNAATVSPDANVTVKVNGKELSTQYENQTLVANVKRDSEATITFELTDYELVGLYNGSKASYQGSDSILEDAQEFVYKAKISKDSNYTLVVDASQFEKITLGYVADKPVEDVEGGAISLNATGESVYQDKENKNIYWAKNGTDVTVSYSASEYDFAGWKQDQGTDYVSQAQEYKFSASADTTITADFKAFVYYQIKVESAIDQEVAGGSVTVAVNDAETVKVRSGQEVILTASAVGYNFAGWENEAQEAIGNGSATYKFVPTESMTYTANFTAKQFLVTYNYGSGSTEQVTLTYGEPLKSDVADVYEKGWKVFQGWETAGKVYTAATFSGTAEEVELTAAYTVQSEIDYTINIDATDYSLQGSISYNTANGLVLDKQPSRNFYNLVGIKIGDKEYRFNDDATAFVEAQNGIDRYLVDQSETTVVAAPIWELVDDIVLEVPAGSDFYESTGLTMTIAKADNENIEELNILDLLSFPEEETGSIQYIAVEYQGVADYRFYELNFYDVSLIDVLNEINFAAAEEGVDNTITIKFLQA